MWFIINYNEYQGEQISPTINVDEQTQTNRKHNTAFNILDSGNTNTPLIKTVTQKKKIKLLENTKQWSQHGYNTWSTVKHKAAEDEANARLSKFTSCQCKQCKGQLADTSACVCVRTCVWNLT